MPDPRLLAYRDDMDLDGWPDVWDIAPNVRGYRNGRSD